MTQIISYLTFNGNCREAMQFYRDCLGGELSVQTIGESPMADQMPAEMRDCVMHSSLTDGHWTLMASDMVGENGLLRGNSVAMLLNFDSEANARECYAKLAVGGKSTHPLEETFWGAIFGDLTDRFGNHWLLNFDRNQPRQS